VLHERDIQCPWCGESFTVLVDLSYGESEYVEDCQVCCRPISLHLRLDEAGEIDEFGVERE
jgi:hypothetical protein